MKFQSIQEEIIYNLENFVSKILKKKTLKQYIAVLRNEKA